MKIIKVIIITVCLYAITTYGMEKTVGEIEAGRISPSSPSTARLDLPVTIMNIGTGSPGTSTNEEAQSPEGSEKELADEGSKSNEGSEAKQYVTEIGQLRLEFQIFNTAMEHILNNTNAIRDLLTTQSKSNEEHLRFMRACKIVSTGILLRDERSERQLTNIWQIIDGERDKLSATNKDDNKNKGRTKKRRKSHDQRRRASEVPIKRREDKIKDQLKTTKEK